MSNRRKPRAAQRSSLDAMTGHRTPGGCDDCNAYQTMTSTADGVYELLVHHDATCPWLNARGGTR